MCALNTVQIGLFDIVFEFFLNAFAFLLAMLDSHENRKRTYFTQEIRYLRF